MFFPLFLVAAEDADVLAQDLTQAVDNIRSMNFQQMLARLKDFAIDYLPKVVTALLVFLLGHLLILTLLRLVKKFLSHSKVDTTLHAFILSVAKISLYLVLFVICLSLLRIPLAPLVTVLGSAGLALSLALKDSLSNVAGGISVLFNRPFTKGDLVEIKGITGVVQSIELVYTHLITDDDKLVFLPNGDVAKSIVTNYSKDPLKRLDFVFFVPLTADFEKAKEIILSILRSSSVTLPQPEPIVRMSGKDKDSISISCKVWAKEEYYDTILGPLNDEIDRRLKDAGM